VNRQSKLILVVSRCIETEYYNLCGTVTMYKQL